MLEIQACKSPADKAKLLKKFNPKAQTWIVSDLQSKWHLQGQLLQERRVLEEQAVLRASEYWKKMAVQVLPDMRLLSPELTQSLFWHWLEPLNLPWMRTPNSLRALLQQMRQWIGVFKDPDYSEKMAEWFSDEKNSNCLKNWGGWFKASEFIWNKCVEENVIVPSWLPALLLQRDLSGLQISKDLIFDLGVELTPVEALLIQELGRSHAVKVLKPDSPWCEGFHQPMYGYEILESRAHKERTGEELPWPHLGREQLSFVRYSTRVAEIKAAVSQVREWLDAGVPAQKIGLIAPDIEQHWPILDLYLQQEGILVRKSKVTRMHSFPEMAKWLSNLRLACEQVSTSDLEASLFMNQDELALSFDNFRVLYSSVYGPEDIGRAGDLAERWSRSTFGEKPMSQDEFFIAAVKFWRGGEKSQVFLERFAQFVTQDCPESLKLMPEEWLNYWQGILARIEIPVREELGEGIWCVSLSSTDWLDLSHGLFLNMSAGDLRQLTQSPIPFSDLEKLSNDLGYPVDSPDRQQREFEFLWLTEKNWQQLVCSFAQTDAEGKVLTPSRLWLWGGHLQGHIPEEPVAPGVTRWDQLQRSSVSNIGRLKNWQDRRTQSVVSALQRDQGNFLSWPKIPEWKISVSKLEKYFECPFIFAAQNIFRLSDDAVLDLDIDRMSAGRLMHALFARVIVEPVRFDWTDVELKKLIEECREQESIEIGEKKLWDATVAAHVHLAKLLLQMERDWRAQFPKTRTLATELSFKGYLDPETGAPSKTPTPFSVSGRLDRVDGDGKNYVLIDYKSSLTNLSNIGRWVEKDAIQLAMYSQMLERGLTDLPAGEVESAQYYVPKKRKRHKGYLRTDGTGELYDPSVNYYTARTDKKKLEEVRKNINANIARALSAIVAGEFDPKPKDSMNCLKCHWSKVCRGPHLS